MRSSESPPSIAPTCWSSAFTGAVRSIACSSGPRRSTSFVRRRARCSRCGRISGQTRHESGERVDDPFKRARDVVEHSRPAQSISPGRRSITCPANYLRRPAKFSAVSTNRESHLPFECAFGSRHPPGASLARSSSDSRRTFERNVYVSSLSSRRACVVCVVPAGRWCLSGRHAARRRSASSAATRADRHGARARVRWRLLLDDPFFGPYPWWHRDGVPVPGTSPSSISAPTCGFGSRPKPPRTRRSTSTASTPVSLTTSTACSRRCRSRQVVTASRCIWRDTGRFAATST